MSSLSSRTGWRPTVQSNLAAASGLTPVRSDSFRPILAAKQFNGIGLDHAALLALPPEDRTHRIATAAEALREAGADYVIDSVAELWPVVEAIAARIEAGKRPAVG